MKSTFEKVKELVELGHKVAVEDIKGNWKVFTHINGLGYIEGCYNGVNIQESLKDGLSGEAYTEEDFTKEFTDTYEIISQPPKLLKVGDKVRVLESVMEIGESVAISLSRLKSMLDARAIIIKSNYMKYTIEYDYDGCKVGSHVPHWAVVPDYSEEVKEMTKEMTKEELEKELGYKFKIVE